MAVGEGRKSAAEAIPFSLCSVKSLDNTTSIACGFCLAVACQGAYGCASAIASTSMMSEIAIGMTLEEAYHITPEMITGALGGLPEHKFHCSVLGDKALRAAIDDYLEKNGIENTLKNSTAKVICECKGVTDQMIEELVKSDKVKNFDELQAATGCSTACGKCRSRIMDELNEFLHIYGK